MHPYVPMTLMPLEVWLYGGWKAPSNIDTTEISVIKMEAPDDLSSKSSSKRLPAVLDGMDKAEALATSPAFLMPPRLALLSGATSS